MLDKEFDWYLAHQNELVEQYNGKHIVIKDGIVVGFYDSTLEAYLESKKKYKLGTFLIQLCTPGEKDYTVTFHHNLAFTNGHSYHT